MEPIVPIAAGGDFLIDPQKHNLRDLYPRVELLDLLLLGLRERVLRDQGLDFGVGRVVQLRGRLYQREERLEQDEAGGGVRERRFQERVVFAEEGEPV